MKNKFSDNIVTFSNLGNFGRLGNQLFQIAATLGLSRLYSKKAKFYKWNYSTFFKNPIDQSLTRYEIKNSFRERNFYYETIPNIDNLDIIGYFQSEKHFSHCKDLILYHFDFIDSLYDSSIDHSQETCSLHIRRGDYLRLIDYHPPLNLDYYLQSMDQMRKLGVTKFYIFSDDIDWCMLTFSGLSDVEFIQGNTDIKDICLMSSCKNNIIANSSFSWWGAWLNKNPNKKVIAPKIWFGPAKKIVITNDIYCENWIKI